MGTADCKSNRAGVSVSYWWISYCSVSLLALLILCIDPYVNAPSGLIALGLFTREPVQHGTDACSWDYDGSWKIGGLSGTSLQTLIISEKPLFTCEHVETTSASFVAAPFLHIPEDGEASDPSVWSLFFELRNLRSYTSEIGVAISRNRGVSWQFRGTVLSDPRRSFSAPFVVYDAPSKSYIMLPNTNRHDHNPHGGLPAYTTTAAEFPLGWRPAAPNSADYNAHHGFHHHHGPHHDDHHQHDHPRSHHRRRHLADRGRPHTVTGADSPFQPLPNPTTPTSDPLPPRPWGPPPTHPTLFGAQRRTHYQSTTAVQHNDRWWIFTTRVQLPMLPWLPADLTSLVFTTAPNSSLMSPWRLHRTCSDQHDYEHDHDEYDAQRHSSDHEGDDGGDRQKGSDADPHRKLHAAPHPGGCSRVSSLAPATSDSTTTTSTTAAGNTGSAGTGEGGATPPPDKADADGDVLVSAGRPFVWQGAVHRWVRRCGPGRCSHELDLLRSRVADEGSFVEEVAARYAPAASDRSWHAQRLGHADVRWVRDDESEGGEGGGGGGGRHAFDSSGEGGRWWGVISGDRYENGMHHFLVHESWFVELKTTLRNFVAAQLALALVVAALVPQAAAAVAAARHGHYDGGEDGAGGASGGRMHGGLRSKDYCGEGGAHCAHHYGPGSGGKGKYSGGILYGNGGGCVSGNGVVLEGWVWLLAMALRLRSSPVVVVAISAANGVSRVTQIGVAGLVTGLAHVEYGIRRAAAQPAVQFFVHAVFSCFVAMALALVVMVFLPYTVPCPRWTVVVKPFGSSPHYVPQHPYVDLAAPYNVRNLTLVSGCTMSFMDRLENLVGSLQYWEPDSPILLYDLGFTTRQLATVRCWRGVQVVRFPYEDYPAHVREIGNYAFKPLVFAHALARNPAMLWIDCGLEVRGPLDSMRATLSHSGHVSAQQSKSPSQFPFTEKYTLPFFNFSAAEYERVKDMPFCAGGLQGFVAGSAAERLVLRPAMDCALDPNCISPPGHTQTLHMYDQTALTLHIRMYNFSSCMPRETHCTSAVKKTSWDPTASSEPIVIASRRHRWPKPYRYRVASQPGCVADPAANPWRSVSSEHPETVAKSSSLLFKLGYVYGQAAGDLVVQAGCCLGFHLLAQGLVGLMILNQILAHGDAYRRLLLFRICGLGSHSAGLPLSPHTHGCMGGISTVGAGGPNGLSGGGAGGWAALLLRTTPQLAALVLQWVVMALSMGVTCRVP